jgi:endoglycosylceramidase
MTARVFGLSARVLALSAVVLAGCGGDGGESPDPVPTGYHVTGGFLRDPEGRALLLRGMNVSGMQKAAPYFDFHTLPDYQRIRDPWGMTSMRFVMTWAAVEPEEGVYDETYLDALAERMDWARQAGVYVVLDMHQDVYGEGFASGGGDGAPRWTCDASHYASFVPNPSQWFYNYLSADVTACYDGFWNGPELQAHYAAAWQHVAERLAGYDDVILGFDPMNEPYWGSHIIVTFESDVLQPFYETIVAAVRSVRPEWIAFLEPASSRNLGIPTSLTGFPFPDVMYAPHSYDRNAEMGLGFDPADTGAVLQNAEALAGEAASLGAGLWVGEYGAQTSTPGVTPYMDAEYAAFGAVAAGSTYWDYSKGGGYSTLNADGSESTELMAALVRPWPERVAGTPVSFSFDAATTTFTLTYRPDRTTTAPTVLSVPARAYPQGFQVVCGSCLTQNAPGEVDVLAPPPGDEVTITIEP